MKLTHGSEAEQLAYCARRIEQLKTRLAGLPARMPPSASLKIEAEIRSLYRRQAELQTRRLL